MMFQGFVENEEKFETYNVSVFLEYVDDLKEHVLDLEDELSDIFSDDYLNITLNKKGEELKAELVFSRGKLTEGQSFKREILIAYEKKHVRYKVDLDKLRDLLDEKETAILKKEKKLKKQIERRFILKFQKQIEDLNLSILRIKERLPNSVLKDENKKFFELRDIGFLKNYKEVYTKKIKEIAADDNIRIGRVGFRNEDVAEVDMKKYIEDNRSFLEENLRNHKNGKIKEGVLKIEINGEIHSFDMGSYFRQEKVDMENLLFLTKRDSFIRDNDLSTRVVSNKKGKYEVKVEIHNKVKEAFEIFKLHEGEAMRNPAFLSSTLFDLAIKKQKELDRLAKNNKDK